MINKDVAWQMCPTAAVTKPGQLCPVKKPDPALCGGAASSLLGLKVFIVVLWGSQFLGIAPSLWPYTKKLGWLPSNELLVAEGAWLAEAVEMSCDLVLKMPWRLDYLSSF